MKRYSPVEKRSRKPKVEKILPFKEAEGQCAGREGL